MPVCVASECGRRIKAVPHAGAGARGHGLEGDHHDAGGCGAISGVGRRRMAEDRQAEAHPRPWRAHEEHRWHCGVP
eukprot:scaffold4390_cov264-Pinguiococcus_pyrenoidosus.AAC.9